MLREQRPIVEKHRRDAFLRPLCGCDCCRDLRSTQQYTHLDFLQCSCLLPQQPTSDPAGFLPILALLIYMSFDHVGDFPDYWLNELYLGWFDDACGGIHADTDDVYRLHAADTFNVPMVPLVQLSEPRRLYVRESYDQRGGQLAFSSFTSKAHGLQFHNRTVQCSHFVPSGSGYLNLSLSNSICNIVGASAERQAIDGDEYIDIAYSYSAFHIW